MAPVFAQTAWAAPKGTAPVWVHTQDGKRLRLFGWKGGSNGTVYIYQGRTEYTEKYFPSIQKFIDRGYNVITWDWRGQGLSTRSGMKRRIGHVDDFADFQHDVKAALDYANAHDFKGPKIAVAHSMGGLICLRSLHENIPFDKVIFSAPMWAIEFSFAMSIFASVVCKVAKIFGKTAYLSPTQSIRNYVINHGFEGNTLTNNPIEFENICKTLNANPDLELAGPSIHWVNEAIKESKALIKLAPPSYKTLTLLGGEESIVDTQTIQNVMENWNNGHLVTIQNAQHELLIELPEVSSKAWAEIDQFLAS